MRTFHTGGIFTADPSRQIRAKKLDSYHLVKIFKLVHIVQFMEVIYIF